MINEIQLYNYLQGALKTRDNLHIGAVYLQVLRFEGYLMRTRARLDYYRPILHDLKEANHSGDVLTFTKGLDALVEALEKKNNGKLSTT